MNNPYAHASGPAPATPEAQKRADYELAIGQNAEYFLPKFEEFDKGGSKLGWNWPAFFVTTPWFLYRKMWGWGMGNLAYFWGILTFIGPMALGIAAGAAAKGSEVSAMVTVGIVIGVLLLIPAFLLPMFANALYWGHLNKMMEKIPSSIAQQPDKRATRIERNGGTGMGAMVGVLVGGVFIFVAIIGVLAAIAIPAYQDYTIRSQIAEGLNLAAGPKAAVAEYYAQNKAWPENNEAAGMTGSPSGKYVESVNVEKGSIVIFYGGTANPKIVGKTLILRPGVTENEDVVWECANVESDGVQEYGEGPHGTDLPMKYLPANCRT
jgi:type IV pilus assembly protein PilA